MTRCFVRAGCLCTSECGTSECRGHCRLPGRCGAEVRCWRVAGRTPAACAKQLRRRDWSG
eukprot:3854035-Rhodomonas_salina.1